MHWIYLIHEFHNLSWITEINELFQNILIYWDAPVHTYMHIIWLATHNWNLFSCIPWFSVFTSVHVGCFPQGFGMDPHVALALPSDAKLAKEKKKSSMAGLSEEEEELSIRIGRAGVHSGKLFFTNPHVCSPELPITQLHWWLSLGPFWLFL